MGTNKTLPCWEEKEDTDNNNNNKSTTITTKQLAPVRRRQRDAINLLLQGIHPKVENTLHRILLWWLPAHEAQHGPARFRERLRHCVSSLPERLVFSTIRLVYNAANTSNIFRDVVLPCCICGLQNSDDIGHCLCCPEFIKFLAAYVGASFAAPHDPSSYATRMLLLDADLPESEICASVIANDCLVQTINTYLHDRQTPGHLTLAGRLRQ